MEQSPELVIPLNKTPQIPWIFSENRIREIIREELDKHDKELAEALMKQMDSYKWSEYK
jgi:hypothetical protein